MNFISNFHCLLYHSLYSSSFVLSLFISLNIPNFFVPFSATLVPVLSYRSYPPSLLIFFSSSSFSCSLASPLFLLDLSSTKMSRQILQKNVYIIVIIVILPLLTEDGTISSISFSNFIKSRNINSQNLCEKHETSARKFVKKFLKYPPHNQKQNFQQHILIEKKKQMEDRINGWSLMRVNNPLRPPFPFTFHPPPISLIFHTSWPPFFLSLHSSLGFFSFLRRFARPAAFFTGRPVISSWSRTSHTYLPPPNLSSLCIGTRRRRRKAFV